ncbi:unnamed protein product [marine sediment metagenome]|uniref:Uncharacterized protein n=1 Tax=marine sediment metagenome TaxID=412755 RepID=X1MIJ4_9ZZZZ
MAQINNAIEPLTFGMTQTTWVKALERGKRTSINIENENLASAARYQFPIGDNPFAYDFVTNTDIAITPVLSAANTWASSTKGQIKVRFKADAHAGIRYLVSYGDTNADTHLSLWVDDDEKIAASAELAGTAQWTFKSDNAIIAGVWYEATLRQEGVVPTLKINGSGVPITFSVTTDQTAWMADLPLIDNAFIGVSSFNSAGKADYFEGEIDYVVMTQFPSVGVAGGNTTCGNFRLSTGSGTTATDSSTFGDHGTITAGGGAWIARNDGTLIGAGKGKFLSVPDGDAYIERALWVYTAAASHDIELLEARTAHNSNMGVM